MSADSKIEWTDTTWNPTRGCTRVSEGCRNCYAEAVAARFSGAGLAYEGLAERRLKVLQDGSERLEPRWTGKTRFVEEQLGAPLRWRKPRRVFVNSMSDLFHEGFTDVQIDRVFAVMALAPQHTFQVLTKRPARMLRWFTDRRANVHVYNAAAKLIDDEWSRMPGDMANTRSSGGSWWPLPNVHLGVSVENQKAAEERIPLLLQAPAALRFLSVEPLIGPVDLTDLVEGRGGDAEEHTSAFADRDDEEPAGVDWVIVGGESGPGARPCNVKWIRSVVHQCQRAKVPVFVKQLGAYYVDEANGIGGAQAKPDPTLVTINKLRDRKGGDLQEFPEDLRVREFPKGGAR